MTAREFLTHKYFSHLPKEIKWRMLEEEDERPSSLTILSLIISIVSLILSIVLITS